MVRRDLAPLFDADLRGNPIGAIRDITVLKWTSEEERGKVWQGRKQIRTPVEGQPAETYFNAGVLVLDTAAIRAAPDELRDLMDFETAEARTVLDQDHLNHVFRGKVTHLNAAWNSSWGRHGQQRAWTAPLHPSPEEAARIPAGILHFHGPHKPWRPWSRYMLKRGAAATAVYKIAMRRFLARYPDAVFT